MVQIRIADAGDLRFLHEMLLEAAYPPERGRPSVEEMLGSPAIAKYVSGWGRHGDAAVVAVDERGRRLGAAWYRLFSSDERGFGFVDTSTPEISIAVLPAHRGRGIGSSLLTGLIERARQQGFAALSLSVSPRNPAAALYSRFGFTRVPSSDEHWTMRLDLEAAREKPLETIETDHLVLRTLTEADLESFAHMYADPEVMRHAGSPAPRTREESERELREFSSHWAVHGFGSWAVTDRETGDFLGVIELKYAGAGVEGIEPDEVEIGWTLVRPSWGRGLATEAARAAAHHVFERLGVPWLVAYVRPANVSSLRVAEKLGMRYEGEGRAHNGDTVRIFRLCGGT